MPLQPPSAGHRQAWWPHDLLPVPKALAQDLTIQLLRVEILESACRAWWEAPGPDGKRIATCSWDEWVAKAQRHPEYQQSVDDYRRRMSAALIAAIGWP